MLAGVVGTPGQLCALPVKRVKRNGPSTLTVNGGGHNKKPSHIRRGLINSGTKQLATFLDAGFLAGQTTQIVKP